MSTTRLHDVPSVIHYPCLKLRKSISTLIPFPSSNHSFSCATKQPTIHPSIHSPTSSLPRPLTSTTIASIKCGLNQGHFPQPPSVDCAPLHSSGVVIVSTSLTTRASPSPTTLHHLATSESIVKAKSDHATFMLGKKKLDNKATLSSTRLYNDSLPLKAMQSPKPSRPVEHLQ